MSQDQPTPDTTDSEPSLPSEPLPDIPIVVAESIDPEPPAVTASLDAAALTSSQPSSPLLTIDPAPSTSKRGARSTAPENDEILPQTLLRLMGEAIIAAQPSLQRQGVKALRGTIHLLEKAVAQLEAEPLPKQAKKKALASGAASKHASPPSSKRRTNKLAPLSTNTLREKFQTSWQQIRRWWRRILRQIRDRLPVSINRKWSDQALTGAIVGMFAIVLWLTAALLPDRPAQTTVATPPTEVVAPSPSPIPSSSPIPPLVKAPEAPKPVEISPAPVKPSPPPPLLKLTPEQTLIVRIQDQVSAISNQYADGLVETVQANFRSSRLIVHIGDGWYGLGQLQQNKLANELLRRTQTLNFSKLELVDGTETLLARSPVVGSEMIILKQTKASTQAV